MIRKLRRKFVCIVMALVLSLLLLVLMGVNVFTAGNLEKEAVLAMRAALERPVGGMRPVQSCFVIQKTPHGYLGEGNILEELADQETLAALYEEAAAQRDRVGVLKEAGLRYCRQEGLWGDRVAFSSLKEERYLLAGLTRTSLLVFGAAALAFWGISILLARWAVGPVEKAWKQQRQFVADASHELKTPLTVILTNAEMLQSTEYSPEEKSRFATGILDVSRQMRTLVESLLQLARADRGVQAVEMGAVDFSTLAENAVLPFEPVYFEQGLVLESRLEPGLTVRGDSVALRQVVDILLDNGSKYAAPGGTASLEVYRQGKRVVLRFLTPGEPLTQAQCRDIFKRFYRVDEARTPSGSYGLGLSIAQNIVMQHGGRIWAEGVKEGNVFTVQLPEL